MSEVQVVVSGYNAGRNGDVLVLLGASGECCFVSVRNNSLGVCLCPSSLHVNVPMRSLSTTIS